MRESASKWIRLTYYRAFYVLDSTASNYIYGRQPMTSAAAWQLHGCYALGSTQYYQMPLDAARNGCKDDGVGLDHRDASHPVHNIIKHMYFLRQQYPVLNDGWYLRQLANQTHPVQYPGSDGVTTETGIWSVLRDVFPDTQENITTAASQYNITTTVTLYNISTTDPRYNISSPGLQYNISTLGFPYNVSMLASQNNISTTDSQYNISRIRTQNITSINTRGDQGVWLVYHNENDTTTYNFNCAKSEDAMIAAFKSNTTVKNLFYPHDEITLEPATDQYGNAVGCTSNITMKAYEFKAYVPIDQFIAPPPLVTKFSPGHDVRVQSTVAAGSQESLEIEIHFSKEMNCDQITSSILFNSTTEDLRIAQVRPNTVNCSLVESSVAPYVGAIPGVWSWKAILENLSNGVHAVTVRNATAMDGTFSNSNDRFLFRVGQLDNPMVFPFTANYTRALIHRNTSSDTLYISHKAAGADKWRYSLNWGSSWSDWQVYQGGNDTLQKQPWSGTKKQQWDDTHIIAQYWGRLAGSSAILQHADLGRETLPPRRFPHIFAHGPFNQYGFDAGLNNELKLDNKDGRWKFHFMTEWSESNTFQLNVWGMNPDGQPDASAVYGDIDGDGVLDRLPPSSLSKLNLSVSAVPPSPYLAYQLSVDDGTLSYTLFPVGDRRLQLILFLLLAFVPLITGCFAIWMYMNGFYAVKFNEIGISEKTGFFQLLRGKKDNEDYSDSDDDNLTNITAPTPPNGLAIVPVEERKTVLIATMEYDIEDWAIKIKIGGLGVMAQLMGKNLEHQDLIWVVPCVGGVDYPVDEEAPPMVVSIMGTKYDVSVQYHKLRNITYVLLDAPVFRAQTKSEPYPPRMDDMDSAVYYSAWNQCIAQALERFPITLYHINDYHGAAAPLYMLPRTIPCCMSLHNAEFQGLWPMRTPEERTEVCSVFNLDEHIVARYIQFGSVFNLLHAGASYLRIHQKGLGAVGVSKKYGKRSWARYPIFWGLSKIGQLPNPDPTDTEAWDKQLPKESDIVVDQEFEAGRAELKRQAQEWAGLEQRADAELFVFVGRWSTQKGVDLIADVFPSVLDQHDKAQLVCIGPVIDLYGKFAALKLAKMMEKYPGRVFSKPEFTALPPYLFSGAEFALIPSRDEPFGLVAVEFGRKGALGVGARVGGLGQMPGWWYTVESITTSHLLKQFRGAIDSALASKHEVRAMMRARSAKQRFPVQQWKEDLGILQAGCIKMHHRESDKSRRGSRFWSTHNTFSPVLEESAHYLVDDLPQLTFDESNKENANSIRRTLSLGSRRGPGHQAQVEPEDDAVSLHDEYILQIEDEDAIRPVDLQDRVIPSEDLIPERPDPTRASSSSNLMSDSPSPDRFTDIEIDENTLLPPRPLFLQTPSNRSSLLSLGLVVGERKDYNLQKVDPFFTDSSNEFYNKFGSKLVGLNAKNSETEMCIEEFLVKSERSWFKRFRDARLGMSSASVSRAPSIRDSMVATTDPSPSVSDASSFKDEFLLGQDYKPPRLLKK
jgi:alpha-1,3-glucan synthase